VDVDGFLEWLRTTCSEYALEPRGIYRRPMIGEWPLIAEGTDDLETQLVARGSLAPLPKEPAALANIIEVAVVDFLLLKLADAGFEATRGSERGYPDLEVKIADSYFAVDVKVARRSAGGKSTQSRITLYTGNTYFAYPDIRWPGTLRPFNDYVAHIDLVVIYTLSEEGTGRILDEEFILHEAWRIASRQRSSTTREYLGAVQNLEDLRAGRGEFKTAEEFYKFWRAYPFKVGIAVKKQLERLLAKRPKNN
jgi:hypothetical protein